MKILGIGIDVVNNKRISKILNSYKSNFKNKIFSKKEIIYCEKSPNPINCFSKRFAAKEAFTKALGTGFGYGISLKNIEVFHDINGKPFIKVTGPVLKKLKKKIDNKKYKIEVSISDEINISCANVIILY
ncbi:MAG: holo-[acyl-carrier-protein] synthase [Candidatus Pelagibacter sp. TMED64]|nr:holo-[acyl-carrier-protein] synthase [Candidatus Pelagibacter sp.]OUU67644.1 MAG: holo-[acyl-carrier-protein] synthase [Candidatus Pelagibacter sp. TMED64]|tara:strand:- start:1863 stop:2252 length:390 start_codon:yes stop_codon:yes gene_type:complete